MPQPSIDPTIRMSNARPALSATGRRPRLVGLALSCCFVLTIVHAAKGADALELPDPLTFESGEKVNTAAEWQASRRGEVLELFRENVYGRRPVERPEQLEFVVVDVDEHALDGAATKKLVDIRYGGPGGEGTIRLVLMLPNKVAGPAPGFLHFCIRPRENVDPDRETYSSCWPVELIIERGYFAAAFHKGDVDPDEYDGFKNGVHGVFDEPPGEPRAGDAWGTIAAWAWGTSRAMDYFETDERIDASRVALVGHSRGGKTALWAGAEDERFAMVVSNNSGCTGAAIARRRQGETVKRINDVFPHWFCKNYRQYNDREDALPVDQHELVALIAPRLVYVASATEDDWADPQGEFLACVHADPVYRLLGVPGLSATEMPPPGEPVHEGRIGYHLRQGKHNLTREDWRHFIDFAERHWKTDGPAAAESTGERNSP